jgi:hypothetical protein
MIYDPGARRPPQSRGFRPAVEHFFIVGAKLIAATV